jgi:hypothetical protein
MKTTLCLMAILFPVLLHAQDHLLTIQGQVVDGTSREPVLYASLYIKGSAQGTATNEEGKFIFHITATGKDDVLAVSALGYGRFESPLTVLAAKQQPVVITLSPESTVLQEVTVHAEKELSAKEIVRKAAARIPENYPARPFAIEGFFRDLQIENDKPVELLEAAVRFTYPDYNPGYESVEILEVRRSHNNRHPVNGTYDRQNALFDLMEDNYVKHRVGPVAMKGWKFTLDSVLTYDARTVYKIEGRESDAETATLYIDTESFAIVKLELRDRMVNGEYYRRYLNLPDPYGLQETSFTMVFEYREFNGKMYLRYQREEDTYNLFNKITNKVLLRQAFTKELFVNNIITENVAVNAGTPMNINRSVESQAGVYNAAFWERYNAPAETAASTKIIRSLQEER